jgi:hypothetical protein
VNLVHWLADQLRHSTEFRAPLKRFASPEEQQAQFAELKRQLLEQLDEQLPERYFAHQNARARSRGWASLPWSVANAAPAMSARVALAAPRALNIVRDDTSIQFDANGRAWKFAAAAEPLLHVLERGPATVAELCNATTLDGATVQQFVAELARQGLVNLAGEPEA